MEEAGCDGQRTTQKMQEEYDVKRAEYRQLEVDVILHQKQNIMEAAGTLAINQISGQQKK